MNNGRRVPNNSIQLTGLRAAADAERLGTNRLTSHGSARFDDPTSVESETRLGPTGGASRRSGPMFPTVRDG